jgi:short-subunit dehydrogenase
LKKAIVTGASSGIGFECAKALIANNYEVVGIGRKDSVPNGVKFLKVDLLNKIELESCAKNALQLLDNECDLLLNSAGIGYFAPHEELSSVKLRAMVELNLLVPLELSRQLLRTLKKSSGHIINIASITAKKPSPQGAAYSATKAGILHFGDSLFEEVRKSGVRITTLVPDMTKTPFFDNTWFEPADNIECYIDAKSIADALIFAITSPSVVSEIVIKPQKIGIINKQRQ